MSDFRNNINNKNTSIQVPANFWNIVVGMILSTALLVAVLKLETSVFRVNYHFDEDGLAKDICAVGMTKVINKEPARAFISSRLLSYLDKNSFPDFDFKISEKEQVRHAEVIGKNKCRLIVHNPNVDGHGLISLHVHFESSKDYELKYKVTNYQELLLTKNDLKYVR